MKCIESLGSIDLHMNHIFMRQGDIEILIRIIRHFEYRFSRKGGFPSSMGEMTPLLRAGFFR